MTFLGDFPVHYAAFIIKRTINNNYMTLLMALHHTHDGFRYFFKCFKGNTHPGTLSTLNLPIKIHPSLG